MGKGVSHTFSEMFLHFNWHCKHDRPLIDPELEPRLHEYLESYCARTKGIHFKGVGGTVDHVHLVVQVEPYIKPSDFAGQIKGASSHEMSALLGRGRLEWQRGYGIVSFAARNLPALVNYVLQQKEHHRLGTTRPLLEKYGEEWNEGDCGEESG